MADDETTAGGLLVLANRTCECPALHDEIVRRAESAQGVLVVAPALNSRLRHCVSDTDDAVQAARKRLDAAVAELHRRGLSARGEVGDAEPLNAVEDALSGFGADQIVISTHPPGESHWLEKDLIERARRRFAQPVTHLVSEYGVTEPV